MLTPISQFTEGVLLIEGVVESSDYAADQAVVSNLKKFIATYEPEYLRKLLGDEIGDAFFAYIKNRPEDENEQVEKWERLITHINEFEVSPIACYVFYWFVRQRQTQPTGLGVTKNNSDNPVVSPNIHLIVVWNMMTVMNKYFIDWMDLNTSDYLGWDFDGSMLEPINELNI